MASLSSDARLAELHKKREIEGDFSLLCQGNVIKAHSFVLATRSEYFEVAQSKEWMGEEKVVEVTDCPVEVLRVVVDFMYGVEIPENFTKDVRLLHLADLFLMDTLKEVAAAGLANSMTVENFIPFGQAGEMFNSEILIQKCAEVVFKNMGSVDWKEIGQLPRVMEAFGKVVKSENEKHVKLNLKVAIKKPDNLPDNIYGQGVLDIVKVGDMVRFLSGNYGSGPNELVEGDLGYVLNIIGTALGVKWLGKEEAPVLARSVEVLAYSNDV